MTERMSILQHGQTTKCFTRHKVAVTKHFTFLCT